MLDELFYAECIGCSCKIVYYQTLCDNCLKNIKKINTFCQKCGYPLSIKASTCNNCIIPKYYNKLFIPYWYQGSIKTLLKKIKFHYNLKGLTLLDYLIKKQLFKFDFYDIITTVPSSFLRRFRRFIHPADYIAKTIAKIYGIKFERILKRKRHTTYQWKLRKKERYENVKNAFSCEKNLFDLKILLVDDIMTTGATINECSKVLMSAGAKKVDCYIFSKGLFT
ncbi:MAG: ComF family protein [Calditerrivibrio sp.]|nr:ComF family protein [Calditerrivibrio sp.]